MDWQKKDVAISEIHRNFPAVEVNSEDKLIFRFNNEESMRLEKLLRKAGNWRELNYDMFRKEFQLDMSIAPYLMSARGLKLFLAWFLDRVLADPDEADVTVDSILSFLTLHREDLEGSQVFSSFLSELDESQLAAIAGFLQFMRSHYDGWHIHPDIDQGFVRRWEKYATRA
jgi:hypothetical protein